MFITIGRYWTWKGKSTNKNKMLFRQIFSFWWLLILSFLAGWTTGCQLVKRNLGSRGHLLKLQSPWRTIDMDESSLVWSDNNRCICTQSIADKEFLYKQFTSYLLKKIIFVLFSKHETKLKQKLSFASCVRDWIYSYNSFFAFLSTMGTALIVPEEAGFEE